MSDFNRLSVFDDSNELVEDLIRSARIINPKDNPMVNYTLMESAAHIRGLWEHAKTLDNDRLKTITTLTKFAQEQTLPEDEALIMEAIERVKNG